MYAQAYEKWHLHGILIVAPYKWRRARAERGIQRAAHFARKLVGAIKRRPNEAAVY